MARVAASLAGHLGHLGQRSSIQLCSSTALHEERAEVLTRPSATRRLALIDRSAREVLADYVEAIELHLNGLLAWPHSLDEKRHVQAEVGCDRELW
ncbi:MAG: hypothetical protein J0M20_03775 [Burkholderiales bacterium]|nr:hypothetical protein [Burkholderiales bacterium]